MALDIIGPKVYSKSGTVFEPQVATLFPDTETLVTEGTTHFQNREAYCDWLEEKRIADGEEPLTASERLKIWHSGVDLIILLAEILIRPDPEQVDRIMDADRQLQEKFNKRRINFQLGTNAKVREVLAKQGELWRVASHTADEKRTCVQSALMKLAGQAIYYYSPQTGTRFLTLKALRQLAERSGDELRQHLVERQKYCSQHNTRGGKELDFFQGGRGLRKAFQEATFPNDDEEALRAEHQRLCKLFEEDAKPHLRSDDLDQPAWLQEMYDALYPHSDDGTFPTQYLGVAAEFHKHLRWLPGGQLKNGHLKYDPVYDEINEPMPSEYMGREFCRARAIVLNFVRDYGDLEHINIGWIDESLSRSHRPPRGQRDVYVVEMKRASEQHRQVRILRMEKWDMTYRLNEGRSLEQAMLDTAEYTEYTQDRYLGCRCLGMNLFGPVHIGQISELYDGTQTHLRGKPIWTPYFERAYVDGIATDKLTKERLGIPGYAERFAQLLGQAAAPNIIIGRGDGDPDEMSPERLIVFFDDGDEIAVEQDGMIKELIVTPHTGSFWYFQQPLHLFASAYACPVLRRADQVPDFEAFARIYLDSMIDRFTHIQREYREDRRAFEQLFHLRNIRDKGKFVDRWECVLRRLDETDPSQLKEAIAACIYSKK